MKTITQKLNNLSRARLDEIAKKCILELIPISQLREMAIGFQPSYFDGIPIDQLYVHQRIELIDFVMKNKIESMPFKQLCIWIKKLADPEELKEVLNECNL